MKKNTKIVYICEAILCLYVILLVAFINNISNDYKNFSAIVVLSLLLVILLAFFGVKKDKNYLKGSSARIVTASLMTFMLIIYGLGLIVGFNHSFYSDDILTLIKRVSPVLLIIIGLELTRYTVIKQSFSNKKAIVAFTVLSSIFCILLELNLSTLYSTEDKFIFLSTIIFPVIAQEALCSYMTYKISLLPSLIYKLVIGLYMYLIPIVPDLGNYIYSVVHILLPFIIYIILSRTVIKYEKEKQQLRKANRIIFTIPIIIILIILVILVSGIFRYKLIAIASNSMSPTYRLGDAVMYEKIDVKQLEVGDILAFQKNDTVVTHRIVKIWNQNGHYYFTTKGDNNNSNDSYKPTEEDVLGKVNFVVKYIGYPTVSINELFGKE